MADETKPKEDYARQLDEESTRQSIKAALTARLCNRFEVMPAPIGDGWAILTLGGAGVIGMKLDDGSKTIEFPEVEIIGGYLIGKNFGVNLAKKTCRSIRINL